MVGHDMGELDTLTYSPAEDELINVVLWCRYPSYDFIFGVPDKSSPKYEKEVGFFQFRDTREKKVKMGIYCDVNECLELINGFTKIKNYGTTTKHHLWQKSMK
jgi:hypothetical protein